MAHESAAQSANPASEQSSRPTTGGKRTRGIARAAAILFRLTRHTFTIASLISLLLFLAIGVLLIRSVYTSDILKFGKPLLRTPRGDVTRTFQVRSMMGTLTFWRMSPSPRPNAQPLPLRGPQLMPDGPWGVELTKMQFRSSPPFALSEYARMQQIDLTKLQSRQSPRLVDVLRRSFRDPPFNLRRSRGGGLISMTTIAVPHWVAMAATAVLPILWTGAWLFERIRGRKRFQAGLCLKCGYDLRASQERCPECGTPIPPDLKRAALPQRPDAATEVNPAESQAAQAVQKQAAQSPNTH